MPGAYSDAYDDAYDNGSAEAPPLFVAPPTPATATRSLSPEYEFLLLDPRDLSSRGELHPHYVSGSWTRRDVAPGSFELTIPRDRIPSLAAIAPQTILVITRDGALEFEGAIETRRVDRLAKSWRLSGPDLLGFWLRQRMVGATAPDDRTGLAEDVLVGYVESALGASAPAPRRVADALIGKTFLVAPSSGRGPMITHPVTRQWLHRVVEDVARKGDLLPSIVLDSAGYRFEVGQPTDATQGSGGIPFGVDWANVEELEFIESYDEFKNALYMLGDGAGALRSVTEVLDVDSIVTRFRREGAYDARGATSTALREAVGSLELLKRDQALVRVRAKPLRASGQAVYRADWDVGWDVTFLEQDLRDEPIDIRVVAATVSLTRARGEDITFELGLHRIDSTLRRLEEAINQLRTASFE